MAHQLVILLSAKQFFLNSKKDQEHQDAWNNYDYKSAEYLNATTMHEICQAAQITVSCTAQVCTILNRITIKLCE